MNRSPKGSPKPVRRSLAEHLSKLEESPAASPPGSDASFSRSPIPSPRRAPSMSSMASLGRGSVSSLSMCETDFDEKESLLLNARRHSKVLQASFDRPGQKTPPKA